MNLKRLASQVGETASGAGAGPQTAGITALEAREEASAASEGIQHRSITPTSRQGLADTPVTVPIWTVTLDELRPEPVLGQALQSGGRGCAMKWMLIPERRSLTGGVAFQVHVCKNRYPMDAPFAVSADDVLAQSTRARLFALLAELKRSAGTVELAERLDLHPNGVRVHLERMEEAGLVARSRVRQAVGRPRDAWTITPGARPGGDKPRAYADLGRWLARAIPPRPGRLRDVEAAGREIGRELATPNAEVRGTAALMSAMSALGCQPRVQSSADDRMTLRLDNCPYRDAVRENQEVICTLHRGITRGLLEVLEPSAKLAGFVPRDPDAAGCLIELSGVSEGAVDQ